LKTTATTTKKNKCVNGDLPVDTNATVSNPKAMQHPLPFHSARTLRGNSNQAEEELSDTGDKLIRVREYNKV
jgi:hypothetical protein